MSHTEQLTDCKLRHAIGAMQQHLDPELELLSIAEVESLTAQCTREELEAMFGELAVRVRARGEAWQRARAGRAA